MRRVFSLLLGLDEQANAIKDGAIDGEAFQRELFDVMLRLWRERAAASPTVLLFDDLHWADSASADLLFHLIQLAGEGPLLFLCVLRPDRQAAGWRVKQAAETEYPHRYREIALKPLSAADSGALAGWITC